MHVLPFVGEITFFVVDKIVVIVVKSITYILCAWVNPAYSLRGAGIRELRATSSADRIGSISAGCVRGPVYSCPLAQTVDGCIIMG